MSTVEANARLFRTRDVLWMSGWLLHHVHLRPQVDTGVPRVRSAASTARTPGSYVNLHILEWPA